ncbi:MAG: hypothetical protein WEB57_00075 [Pseudohongiellaceae bacterium]
MATAFERAYQQTIKKMTIARDYADERQQQIRAQARAEESRAGQSGEKKDK